MTFEEWWDTEVPNSDFSKDQMKEQINLSVSEKYGRGFNLKLAMKDAWENARNSL